MIVLDTNIAAQAATTQYTSFGYNSIAKVGDAYFCASDSGIYQMGGVTRLSPESETMDEVVTAYFELPTMDFGISQQKRLRAVYIGYEADGDLTLKINTELVSAISYTLPASTDGQHARRIIVSRTLKGSYWTFQLYGSGVIFAIDSIKVLPVVRGHGFDQN